MTRRKARSLILAAALCAACKSSTSTSNVDATTPGMPTSGPLSIVSLDDERRHDHESPRDDRDRQRDVHRDRDRHRGGLDTIAGGMLQDDAGGTYAAFGAGAVKGTYTATVAWSAINVVRAIDEPLAGQRTFVAKFFDNDGHVASQVAPIEVSVPVQLGRCRRIDRRVQWRVLRRRELRGVRRRVRERHLLCERLDVQAARTRLPRRHHVHDEGLRELPRRLRASR